MKRRRSLDNTLIYNGKSVVITRENNQELFFEIQNNITTDLSEAVSIMMKLDIKDDDVWKIEIENNKNIDPEKTLYWLSGGDKEWLTMENYSSPWIDCYVDFCDKYSKVVIDIISESKNLGEVREKFNKHLNLAILYNFALSKGFIKL